MLLVKLVLPPSRDVLACPTVSGTCLYHPAAAASRPALPPLLLQPRQRALRPYMRRIDRQRRLQFRVGLARIAQPAVSKPPRIVCSHSSARRLTQSFEPRLRLAAVPQFPQRQRPVIRRRDLAPAARRRRLSPKLRSLRGIARGLARRPAPIGRLGRMVTRPASRRRQIVPNRNRSRKIRERLPLLPRREPQAAPQQVRIRPILRDV